MKFKYYLRGAGVGVIVATVVLSAAFLFQDDISDAQIIQRALELGMVMEEGAPKTLADISQQGATKADLDSKELDEQPETNTDNENTPGSQTDTDETDQLDSQTPTQASEPAQDSTKPAKSKSDKKNNNSNKPVSSNSNTVTVTIVGGDVSRTVSAKVFEAGLVDSADEFNDFLGDHDYDNLLQPGTYEITKGASFEQIARILTSR